MTRSHLTLALVLVAALVSCPVAEIRADQRGATAATNAALRLDVVISRSLGEKLISNMPFTVSVNTDDRISQVRMGGEIPMLNATAPGDGKAPSISYRNIGTAIDARATALEDGRYRIMLSVEDTSVYDEKQDSTAMPRIPGAPAFRTFRASNNLSLRDGQTLEFTAAPDRLSSEVVRIAVKLTVLP